jgi:hypothetical protein
LKLIRKIKNEYGSCLASKCSDYGCQVKLDKISSGHILISGKKYQHYSKYNNKLCDFILFDCIDSSNYRLAVVEMKGGKLGKFSIKGLHEQLQNGANIADKLSRGYEVQAFKPVTVKKKEVDTMARKTMLMKKEYWVQFRDFLAIIEILKHGRSLEFT